MSKISPAVRHVAVGLLVASALGIAFAWWLLAQGRAAAGEFRAQRATIVTLRALADVVERAGGTGDPVREAVAGMVRDDGTLRAARVVIRDGATLEASTDPADAGERAAPRKLRNPEEKPLYDKADLLRQAVETNIEEGRRKEEIEITPLDAGAFLAAAPLTDADGTVVGLVQLETAPARLALPSPSFLPALLAVVAPILVFLGLSLVIGDRRWVLVGVAAVLLIGALGGYAYHAGGTMTEDRRATETETAKKVADTAAKAEVVMNRIGARAALDARPFDPAAWDSNLFRVPRGVVSGTGALDPAALQKVVDDVSARWRGLVWGAGILALAILAFFGGGWAARLGRILVQHRQGYAYVMPAMLAMLLLVFFPFFYGVALSFTDSNLYNTDKTIDEIWVGVANFTSILGDFNIATRADDGSLAINYQNFYYTLFFTIVWTVTNVAIGVTVGLILALILNQKGLALRPVYRVLLILPWAVPNYITALIWRGMFHQQFGVVNQMLAMVGLQPLAWFENPVTSFLTVLATNGWLSFPFMMVISLGALQSIPSDLYEAARVDGASRWKQFTSITLPSLKPALVPAVILSVVWTFNMFNIIFLVSAGEPARSTEILITQAYKIAFEQYRYGYAAAYSTVIFGILLIYGTWQNRVTRATEGI